MTLLVPFDGTELAETGLVRAVEFDAVFDEGVVAVSVIPDGNTEYAREAGWIDGDERFEMEAITARLRDQVSALAPHAEFRTETVGQYAASGTIAKRVRRAAHEEDASMVVIGSKNAGHLTVSVTSVGGTIATDDAYDVLIVRNRSPAKVAKLKDASPHKSPASSFYSSG